MGERFQSRKQFLLATAVAFTLIAPHANAQRETASVISLRAQDLDAALRTLARDTSTQIVFNPATVEGRRTPVITGVATPEQALRQLLAGTGLTYRATGSGAYTILTQATEPEPSVSPPPSSKAALSRRDPRATLSLRRVELKNAYKTFRFQLLYLIKIS